MDTSVLAIRWKEDFRIQIPKFLNQKDRIARQEIENGKLKAQKYVFPFPDALMLQAC